MPLVACIDTETGIVANLESASVEVVGAADAAEIAVEAEAFFRVGTHAPDMHAFIPTRIEVYRGDEPIAQLTADAPAGFRGLLSPGEEERVALRAGPSSASDADRVCGAPAVVRLVYRTDTAATVGALPSLASADVETSDVRCE